MSNTKETQTYAVHRNVLDTLAFGVTIENEEVCANLVKLTQEMFDEIEFMTKAYVEDVQEGWRAVAKTIVIPYVLGEEEKLYNLWKEVIIALRLIETYIHKEGESYMLKIPKRYRMFWRRKPSIEKMVSISADYSAPILQYYISARLAFTPLYKE